MFSGATKNVPEVLAALRRALALKDDHIVSLQKELASQISRNTDLGCHVEDISAQLAALLQQKERQQGPIRSSFASMPIQVQTSSRTTTAEDGDASSNNIRLLGPIAMAAMSYNRPASAGPSNSVLSGSSTSPQLQTQRSSKISPSPVPHSAPPAHVVGSTSKGHAFGEHYSARDLDTHYQQVEATALRIPTVELPDNPVVIPSTMANADSMIDGRWGDSFFVSQPVMQPAVDAHQLSSKEKLDAFNVSIFSEPAEVQQVCGSLLFASSLPRYLESSFVAKTSAKAEGMSPHTVVKGHDAQQVGRAGNWFFCY